MATCSFHPIPPRANFSIARDGAALQPTHDSSDAAVDLARRGQFAEAARLFRNRLQEAPTDATAHHNYAVFLSEQKRVPEAIREYQEATRFRPKYPEALRNFAILLTSERRFEEALGCLWTAVSIRPEDVQIHIALMRMGGKFGRQ